MTTKQIAEFDQWLVETTDNLRTALTSASPQGLETVRQEVACLVAAREKFHELSGFKESPPEPVKPATAELHREPHVEKQPLHGHAKSHR